MRTLSGISLLLGALFCIQSAQADVDFNGKRRFFQTQKYTDRPSNGQCVSFDFETNTPVEEGAFFPFCEGTIGGNLNCAAGWVTGIRRASDTPSGNYFCVDFTFDPQGVNEQKHLWVAIDGSTAVQASDCKGPVPLGMYQATTMPGMCGMIPDTYLGQFRFKMDDADQCFSIDIGSTTPREGSDAPTYCDAGDKTCHERGDAVYKMISSHFLDETSSPSRNWTCVHLDNSEGTNPQYLWLDEGASFAFVTSDSGSSCTSNNPPSESQAYSINPNNRGTCPRLQFSDIRNFSPGGVDSKCNSFDFRTMMGAPGLANNVNFQWCMSNDTLKAECTATAITNMDIDESVQDKTWFCLDFQDRNGDTQHLAIDEAGSGAKLQDSCSLPPSDTESLGNGRCNGLPSNLINNELKFIDFDGHCQSFNFTADTTGGDTPGRLMYSTFRYCRDGAENWKGLDPSGNVRQCDTDAKIQRIHERGNGWYCLEIKSGIAQGGKDHVWLNGDNSMAVLSSDCKDEEVLSFRQSSIDTSDGLCRALPRELTGDTFRFWGDSPNDNNDDCRSFNFQHFITTYANAITGGNSHPGPRDDDDLFVFCQGTGGERECTTNLQRMDASSGSGDLEYYTSSVMSFNAFRSEEDNDFYCVQFHYRYLGNQASSPVALWMHAGDSSGNGKGAFFHTTDCSTLPSDPEEKINWLAQAECQQIPSGARDMIRWKQGDDRYLSVDFHMHPGKLNTADEFEYCEHNGHCHMATVKNISNPGLVSDVCVDFTYTTTYGLTNKHRGVWVSGDSATLVDMCQEGNSGAQNSFEVGMVERLPGELQEKLSFWQHGTCISFGFNQPPSEQNPNSMTYCEDVNHNNWCASSVTLEHVVNPDGGKENWYCVTLKYPDEYGIMDYRYLWFNPHYYEWNVGYGEVVDDCNGSPPSPTSQQQMPEDGSHVLRLGMCQNFPNVHPYDNPSHSPPNNNGD